MDQNENELESLESLSAQSSDLELLKATPSEFNVFEAVGVVFQEAVAHLNKCGGQANVQRECIEF